MADPVGPVGRYYSEMRSKISGALKSVGGKKDHPHPKDAAHPGEHDHHDEKTNPAPKARDNRVYNEKQETQVATEVKRIKSEAAYVPGHEYDWAADLDVEVKNRLYAEAQKQFDDAKRAHEEGLKKGTISKNDSPPTEDQFRPSKAQIGAETLKEWNKLTNDDDLKAKIEGALKKNLASANKLIGAIGDSKEPDDLEALKEAQKAIKAAQDALNVDRAMSRKEILALGEQLRESSQHNRLAHAHHERVGASPEDTFKLTREIAGLQEQQQQAKKPVAKLTEGAATHLANVEKGERARETLRAESLDKFFEGLKQRVVDAYDPSKSGGFTPAEKALYAKSDKDTLLKKLDGQKARLGAQFESAMNIVNNPDLNLTAEKKFELQAEMLMFAAEYKGDKKEFAVAFFEAKAPELAPVNLAKELKSHGIDDPKKVYSLSIERDENGHDILVAMQGSQKTGTAKGKFGVDYDTMSGNKIVKIDLGEGGAKKGLNFAGLRTSDALFVNIDTTIASEKTHLFATENRNLKLQVRDPNINGTPDADQRYAMADAAKNLVFVGGDKRAEAKQQSLIARHETMGKHESDKSIANATIRDKLDEARKLALQERAKLDPDVLLAQENARGNHNHHHHQTGHGLAHNNRHGGGHNHGGRGRPA